MRHAATFRLPDDLTARDLCTPDLHILAFHHQLLQNLFSITLKSVAPFVLLLGHYSLNKITKRL